MKYVWIWLVILLTGCAHGDGIMKQPREFGTTRGVVVEISEGAVWGVYDEMGNEGWLLEPGPGETMYVLEKIGPLPDNELRFITCSDGARTPLSGCVFVAVSDYATGRWVWNDVGIEGWYRDDEGNVLYDWFVGHDMKGVEQPVSPDGYVYLLIVAHDGAHVWVHNSPRIAWEAVEDDE